MKLRITSKQLRFRLSEQEAQLLLKEKSLAETLYLPVGQKLDYLIKISDQYQPMHLDYDNHALTLTLPVEHLESLIKNPSKEGLSASYIEQDKNILFSLEIELPTSMCQH